MLWHHLVTKRCSTLQNNAENALFDVIIKLSLFIDKNTNISDHIISIYLCTPASILYHCTDNNYIDHSDKQCIYGKLILEAGFQL